MSNRMINTNGRKLATQQSVNAAIWSICDIMRRGNCASALQYVPELTWILFLRILDEKEEREQQEAEALGVPFRPSLEEPYRWRDWAAPLGKKRKELESGSFGAFLGFVNGQGGRQPPHPQPLSPEAGARGEVVGLLPYLKTLKN